MPLQDIASKRLFRVLLFAAGVFTFTLCILRSFTTDPSLGKRGMQFWDSWQYNPQLLLGGGTPTKEPTKRVFLRVGDMGFEGMGSVLQHIKQSIVLSNALDTTLIFSYSKNWAYSTSDIYNAHADPAAFEVDVRRACRLQDLIPQAKRGALVGRLCAGDAAAIQEMEDVKEKLDGCTSILDTDHVETTENLNGCILGWIRSRLAPAENLYLPPLPASSIRLLPTGRPITVGIHIRWGDTAHRKFQDSQFYMSMSISNILRVLSDVRTTFGSPGGQGYTISVAMQHANASVLAPLDDAGFTYTILDTPDRMNDLYALSQHDILLLGESSYAVMAHLIAQPGITIVDFGKGNHHKYTNTSGFGRNVVFMPDYTPESLTMGWRLGSP